MTAVFADKATLEALGWPRILKAWAARTATQQGREMVFAWQFLPDRRTADRVFARLDEARGCMEAGDLAPVDVGETDVRPGLARAQKRATLAPADMLACARLIESAYATRLFAQSRRDALPALAHLVEPLPDLRETSREINATIAPNGDVRDDASSELQALRVRVRRLQESIKERIDGMLQAPEFVSNLQDQYFSVRGDRYVLPVIASFQSRVPGIVHNVSQTGQTVFIEPQELVPLGNALAIAQAEVLEEERRILAALSADIGALAQPLLDALAILATVDLTFAAADLAKAWGAVSPVWDDTDRVRLRGMRHPLLLLQNDAVIPNEVQLDTATRALVISGPNAGGKTAILSGVGLCVLMARAGLAVPTASARLPWFAGLGCVIGDAQDMQAGLSSFSGHLQALKSMLESPGKDRLLLVDEIAADTDPHEGAALARATLESLVDAGARVLVTTHLEEIKVLALTDKRFANASVTLAAQTMRPTYELTLGSAGFSRALAVAEQVGLPTSIMARARALLNDAGLIAGTMQRLQEREDDLTARRTALEEERAALLAQREAALLAEQAAQQALSTAQQRALQSLQDEVAKVRGEVREMMKGLQAQPSMRAAHDVDQALGQQMDALAARARPAKPAAAPVRPVTSEGLRPGMAVHVAHLGQDGEILQFDGSHALVGVGALRMRVKVDQLAAAAHPEKKRPRAAFGDSKTSPDRVGARALGHTKERCDVRGMRADEAGRVVERAMDLSLSAGHRQLFVVHGLGSGALRAGVRELLQHSPYVASFRPADGSEGGEGVTVVNLNIGE